MNQTTKQNVIIRMTLTLLLDLLNYNIQYMLKIHLNPKECGLEVYIYIYIIFIIIRIIIPIHLFTNYTI